MSKTALKAVKQRKKAWFTGLNNLQQEFISSLCDTQSDTIGNILSSYLKAGYATTNAVSTDRQHAVKLYKSAKVQRAIAQYQAEKWEKVDISREITLSRLVDVYDRAVITKDLPAQVSCVKLMMQYNNLLSVNVNVNVEYQEELDQRLQVECREIASARIASIVSGSAGSVSLSPADVAAGAFLPSVSVAELLTPSDNSAAGVASGVSADDDDSSD